MTSDEEPKLTPSALGSQMRAIPSAKRDAAVRANAIKARAVANARPLLPCTCHVGAADGIHAPRCPVYVRQKQRASRLRNKGEPGAAA